MVPAGPEYIGSIRSQRSPPADLDHKEFASVYQIDSQEEGQNICQILSGRMSKYMSDCQNILSEYLSNRMSETISDRMAERMSEDGMSEYRCQKDCQNQTYYNFKIHVRQTVRKYVG